MPGMACCFLHQQMAEGYIPCVCFPFSKLQVTSGLASAWSEQMGVHTLYQEAGLKKKLESRSERKKKIELKEKEKHLK